MAEPQLFPSTVIAGTPTLIDGAEVENQDIALVGQTAGLADDRLLAEFLRITSYGGSGPVSKGIFPTGARPAPGTSFSTLPIIGTVSPTGSANGSIFIQPFRAIIGPRTGPSAGALASYRDNRSGIFIGSATSTTQTIALTPNASGNARWDLVYATLVADAPTNQIQRRLKDPNTGALSIVTENQYLAQPVTVTVLTGTPAPTPTVPTLPADSGTSYNIALAAVHVANGFGAGSTVATTDIRDQAPAIPVNTTAGVPNIRPASGNNDSQGTYATDPAFQWGTTRPGVFLPPSMVGGEQIIVQMDAITSGHPSHADASVIDGAVDWRNRYFVIYAAIGVVGTSNPHFGSDPNDGGNPITLPSGRNNMTGPAPLSNGQTDVRLANSFWGDGLLLSGTATLWYADNGNATSIVPAGATIGVYVVLTGAGQGQMRCRLSATNPAVRVFLWIMASAQLANT